MWGDILLQAALILISVFMYLYMHDVPKKLLTKLRNRRNSSSVQSKCHFVNGAKLLTAARSSSTRAAAVSAAAQAVSEAEKAIALDPSDAASHILKALALDLQGFRTSAIDSFDNALSPIAVKSLSEEEIGDAMYKRAEIKVGLSRRGRVDSAIEDLTRAVKLSVENKAKAYCLLGECYEVKELKEDAVKSYEDAVKVEPGFKLAQEALDRLNS